MQHALEDMETARTTVVKSIAQHKAILSPLRSLPDDILLTIFQWASSSDTRGVDSMSSSRAPWTLSHVSRRWRALAISSPCLWSNITIISRALDISTSHQRDKMSLKLNLHVRRSAECNLFVRVISNIITQVFLEEYLALLLPTAHRWKSLSLAIHSSALAVRLAECHFEHLTKMELNLREPVQVTCHAPNIRDLGLLGKHTGMVDLPWSRVTRYTCDESTLR